MPRTVTDYRCLLISPSDVEKERDALLEVFVQWNAHVGQALGARVELVRWETHAVPDSGQAAQASLNRQIVDQCDFGIAVFWTRLGTPTGSEQSGSVEEVKRLRARGAQVLVYFNAAPVPQESLRNDQFDQLQAFRQEFEHSAFFASYNGLGSLREQVMLHVTTTVAKLLEAGRKQSFQPGVTPEVVTSPRETRAEPPSASATGTVVTASVPDVRVEVGTGLTFRRHVFPRFGLSRPPEMVLAVSLQNYSPVVVYIDNVAFELNNGQRLFFPRDAVTGEFQSRRALQPGDNFSFMVLPHDILSYDRRDNVVCALAIDAIGREYRSSKESMKLALDTLARSCAEPA